MDQQKQTLNQSGVDMMNATIKEFLPYVSQNICWDLQIDKILGFSDDQIDQYYQSLNIIAKGEFYQWLKRFGKCSGGLFTSDMYFIYDHYCDANRQELLFHGIINSEWMDQFVGEGLMSWHDVKRNKPYVFERYNETYYYLINTTDPKLQVWYYQDTCNSKIINTNRTFFEHLKYRLSAFD